MATIPACLLAVVLALACTAASASEEDILRLSTFQLSSPGNGDSGRVTVSGEQSGERVLSLQIEAFGRRTSLSKEQLAKLPSGLVNGVQLNYEVGYEKLGGRTIYVVLSTGHTRVTRVTQVVSVNERGGVEVGNVVSR